MPEPNPIKKGAVPLFLVAQKLRGLGFARKHFDRRARQCFSFAGFLTWHVPCSTPLEHR